MDPIINKIKKHQLLLQQYVENLANERNNSLGSNGGYQAITDTVHNHFQLMRISWQGGQFFYNILLHFHINPDTGNIWVQQNNTDLPLDEAFEAMGIPKNNLVLGFRPQEIRAYSDYAVM